MSLVFVSHWSENSEEARAITTQLSAGLEKRGCEFFLAEEHIKPGSEWESIIKEKLRCADAFVVLCSKNALDRYWVNLEIGAAWVLGKPMYPVRLEEEPTDLPEPLAGRQAYDARRQDGAQQSEAVLHFLDNLADDLAQPSRLYSSTELADRINATLNDVKHDFRRIRQDQPPEKITIRGHETVELTRTFLELTNENNKRQLENVWELLWEKYELVSNMWDRQKDWQDFETKLSDLDGRLMQLLPEMRRHCLISEDLVRIVPELKPFVGKLVEFIVRE